MWLDVERLRQSFSPTKVVGVDIETTAIKDNLDVDLIWCISWVYPDGKEQSLYWENGISKADLRTELESAGTRYELNKDDMKTKRLLELRTILSGESEYVPSFHSSQFDKRHLEEVVDIPVYHDSMLLMFALFPPSVLGSTGEDDAIRFYSLSNAGKLGFCSSKLDYEGGWDKFSQEMLTYNVQDAKACCELTVNMLSLLGQSQDSANAYCVDMAMNDLIISMNRRGVRIDQKQVETLFKSTEQRLQEIELTIQRDVACVLKPGKPKTLKIKPSKLVPTSRTGIYPASYAGYYVLMKDEPGAYQVREIVPFNPGSNVQTAKVLQMFGWEPTKFSRKTGEPSVDEKSLEEFAQRNVVANHILDYRHTKKMLSTYLKPLSKTDEDGRMHPSFLVCATRTSRLSSRNPNFQNLPSGETRKLVIASEGYKIVCIDLSQIELRILAWYMYRLLGTAASMYLWNLYGQGADVHAANAERIGCVRKLAKIAIFLYIYGGGVKRFASSLGISYLEAKTYYNNLESEIEALPQMKAAVIRAARSKKVLRTRYGHAINYPDLNSDDNYIASKAERQYFNALIQGSQADVLKVLLWQCRYPMDTAGAYLLVQVHDEGLFECPTSNVGYFCDQLFKIFNNRSILPGLPIVGVPGVGDTWLEAKKDAEKREDAIKEKNGGRLITC